MKNPVRPRTAPPSEYITLAGVLSNAYRSDAGRPDPASDKPQTTDLVEVIKRLKGARNPAVQAAVARLEAGRLDAIKAIEGVEASADATRRNLEGVLEAADRGEYTQKVERVYQGVDTSGQVRTIRSTQTVDNSGLPIFGAALLNGWVQANAPERMRKRAAAAMEMARLETWDALVPKLPEIYGDCPASRGLVRFRISAPVANRPPEFAVTNTSRHTLTDVTMVVNLLHFSTAPGPTVFQVYFIPKWKAGQELRLPTACVRNRRTEEYTRGRPTIADPDLDSEDAPASFVRNPWLAGLGGVVEARAGLWAAEAYQPVQAFSFPEQARAGARWELDIAASLAASHLDTMARWTNRPPNARVTLPPDNWAARTARRVLTFVPPDSDLARQARLLLDDPLLLFREQKTKRGELGSRMTEPGTVLVGEWKFEIKGFGIGVPTNVRQAAFQIKDKTGRIALRIDSHKEDGTLTATLYDPDQPARKRELTCQYHKGTSGLYFAGLPPRKDRPFVPEDLDILTSPSALHLGFNETGATGISTGSPPYARCYRTILTLKLDPNAVVKPRPRTESEGPGKGKEGVAALAARLAPGTAFKGEWVCRTPSNGNRLPISTRRWLAKLKDKSGRFTLRIDSRNPDTLAVTATLLDTDRPGTKREFKGAIVEERATGRAILYFPAEKGMSSPPRRKVLPTDLDLFTAPENLTFDLTGGRLFGKMPGPVHPYLYWFELHFEARP